MFKKGEVANPKGRPEGSRHKATLAAEVLLEGETGKLTRKAVDMALGGDMIAMRLCLDRVFPVRKGRPTVFPLPPTGTAPELAKAMAEVVRGTSEGELTIDEATGIAQVLEAQRKTIELSDLEARIAAIETKQANG